MSATLGRLFRLLALRGSVRSVQLDGFVDSLLQSFENCRPGLSDETLAAGPAAVSEFFRELYERETPRLLDTIRLQEPHLSPEARAEYARRVDALFQKVLLPAYVRLALRFTGRERNDFYLLGEPLHPLERVLWCGAGILAGSFVVWAPFIPLWEKTWIAPFALGGLFVPEARRYFAVKGYENGLNGLVARAESEIARIDTAYLTSPEPLSTRGETARRTQQGVKDAAD